MQYQTPVFVRVAPDADGWGTEITKGGRGGGGPGLDRPCPGWARPVPGLRRRVEGQGWEVGPDPRDDPFYLEDDDPDTEDEWDEDDEDEG